MELVDFAEVFFNPVAQVKFVHTLSAGYVAASTFVLGISSYYLLKGRDMAFAKRSFAVAAGFGLASVLSVIVLGDESGYEIGDVQQVKLAAIEAEWDTQKPPAGFTLFGIPNQAEMRTDYEVKIPWMMGLIATRSFTQEVKGLKELIAEHEDKIRDGMTAYGILNQLRTQPHPSQDLIDSFDAVKDELGYGLLLKRYTDNVVDASEADIQNAAKDSIPNVFVTFWSFRVMVACGFLLLLLYLMAVYGGMKKTVWHNRPFLWFAVLCIPLPWIAAELGWIVAEMGRQPWTIGGVLPTFMSVSSVTARDVWLSLSGFVLLYGVLIVIEVFLMMKYIKLGPSSLGTGRYYHEKMAMFSSRSN
jgi:cytochrome d ubiquinol oxidase subunit I